MARAQRPEKKKWQLPGYFPRSAQIQAGRKMAGNIRRDGSTLRAAEFLITILYLSVSLSRNHKAAVHHLGWMQLDVVGNQLIWAQNMVTLLLYS